jgi:hypothetical protein
MKKRKINQPILIDDLAALAKMAKTPEWKVFSRMAQNRIQYQKDHIIGLPEYDCVKLAVNKAYDRGIIAGLLLVMKNVDTAAYEMEKLAEKEAE